MNESKVFRDREILTEAHKKGSFSTLLAFFRLSGPGWLQSAITLGGGSLIGALYLGMLGGTSMLWLQLVAITIGVIMLSAISYVTLSTRKRPYAAINEYVNPVLGVGWITATILANMIWILPQFSLCYDALDKNLMPGTFSDVTLQHKILVSAIIGVAALIIVMMSFNPGWMSKFFDILLKLMVGAIVLCFVAAVYWLAIDGQVDWSAVLWGFIPNFEHWNSTAPAVQEMLSELPGETKGFWEDKILANQQSSMIGVTATAVGLNMTFLLPYSMLARGWDKPFRGLARFDLITGLAIPFIIVTTCIVIASAFAFHAKADAKYLSNDATVMESSVLFKSTLGVIEDRYKHEFDELKQAVLNSEINGLNNQLGSSELSDDERADLATQLENARQTRADSLAIHTANNEIDAIKKKLQNDDLTKEQRASLNQDLKDATDQKNTLLAVYASGWNEFEKRIAPTLIKPNAAQLSATLAPLLGEKYAKYSDLIFGIGALAMGFSTIIILMLINSYAFAEMVGQYENNLARTIGAVAAVVVGFCWFLIWDGGSKTWLAIVASTFGAILLPIAYISFFALMNSRRLLGDEKPTGGRMAVWNLLMGIGVLGALAQAYGAIQTKIGDPVAGPVVIGGVVTFGILALVGFSARRSPETDQYDPDVDD